MSILTSGSGYKHLECIVSWPIRISPTNIFDEVCKVTIPLSPLRFFFLSSLN